MELIACGGIKPPIYNKWYFVSVCTCCIKVVSIWETRASDGLLTNPMRETPQICSCGTVLGFVEYVPYRTFSPTSVAHYVGIYRPHQDDHKWNLWSYFYSYPGHWELKEIEDLKP